MLRGSDALENVTREVINACTAFDGTALNASMAYVGGGSGAGQAAMTATSPTQQIAPMSRELNGTACVGTADELIIGLDGVSVVGANKPSGNSESTTGPTVCRDTISGGNRTMVVQYGGCTAGELATGACTIDTTEPSHPVVKYTFKTWKDILAMIYGGQNNGTGARTLADKSRNPDKIACGGAIRRTLLDSWGTIFGDSVTGNKSCRNAACARLKHAFRRGDLSGTTDAFVSLVGLQAIPPFTTTFAGNVPKVDGSATVNPFCNAGDKIMNKGDSDYMDMDPIRRIADSLGGGASNRQGLEQVSQAFWIVTGPPSPVGGDRREIDDPAAAPGNLKPLTPLPDFSQPAAQNWSFDPNTAGSLQGQRDSFAKFVTGTNAGNARQGLGVVLPIEIPTNYGPGTQSYWEATDAAVAQPPVPCTPGKFAPSIICTTCVNVLCPDGAVGTCTLPVDTNVVGTPANPNFNCLSDRAVPSFPPGPVISSNRDPRVYNLLVLDQHGKAVKDNYTNPNLTLSAARQNRFVSAFFRLHTSEVTDFGGGLCSTTIGGNRNPGAPSTTNVCNKFTSTDQIGCLVRASPCSLGYAGREANDNVSTFAAQIEGVQPSSENIKNLAAGVSPAYPLARGLWLNSVKGFANVVDVPGAGSTPADNERTLLTCFGAFGGINSPTNPTSPVHKAMSAVGFVPIDPTDVILPALTSCAVAP